MHKLHHSTLPPTPFLLNTRDIWHEPFWKKLEDGSIIPNDKKCALTAHDVQVLFCIKYPKDPFATSEIHCLHCQKHHKINTYCYE